MKLFIYCIYLTENCDYWEATFTQSKYQFELNLPQAYL